MNPSHPAFHDEEAARELLESARWPTAPTCAHCGSHNVHRMRGVSHAPGMLYCRECRKKFTVTVGTIFEGSHQPLTIWIRAMWIMASHPEGVRSPQLSKALGLNYEAAWAIEHRLRAAMASQD